MTEGSLGSLMLMEIFLEQCFPRNVWVFVFFFFKHKTLNPAITLLERLHNRNNVQT